MVHTFRITKEQYSLGTCRLQGLQREVLTVSVVSSHLSLGIKLCLTGRTLGEAMEKLWRTLEETRKKLGPLEWLRLFEG